MTDPDWLAEAARITGVPVERWDTMRGVGTGGGA